MKFILPFPPSVNSYWRSPNKGTAKGNQALISRCVNEPGVQARSSR